MIKLFEDFENNKEIITMAHEANIINIALVGCGRVSHKHLSAMDSLNTK